MLRRLHDETHVTGVFVTHDQKETLEVADRMVVMNSELSGTPDEVYDHPANPLVLNFLGNTNLFRSRTQNGQTHLTGLTMALRILPGPTTCRQSVISVRTISWQSGRRQTTPASRPRSGTSM